MVYNVSINQHVNIMALQFQSIADSKTSDGHIKWICKCGCGNVSEYSATRVRFGYVVQCKKCAHMAAGSKNKTHGMRNSKEYRAWSAMKARAKGTGKYKRSYGDKGVTVCHEWSKSFELFFSYLGRAPSPDHSIDRIDNDKGYEPGNVRWATWTEQQRNKRCSVFVTNGVAVFHIKEVADKLGISKGAAHLRLKRGTLHGYSSCKS